MSYITLANMGSSGGLCSQLQIYASLAAVAKANDKIIVFSQEMLDGGVINYHNTGELVNTNIRIFDLLDIPVVVKPKEFFNNFVNKDINYHTTAYDETLFVLDPHTNYNLVGRFDTYIYWHNDMGAEVAAWQYKPELQKQAEKRMAKIKNQLGDKPCVSIHIRLGDYLMPNHHFALLDSDYYEKAIQHFTPQTDYNFVVFCNDIDYISDMFEGDNVYYVAPAGGLKVCTDSEKEDLALMSLCDHHITANSSYSWWGAYLGKNSDKRIVCPTNWLKRYHPSSWMNGKYYPPTWTNIDNDAS